jgi:hypothetical protein
MTESAKAERHTTHAPDRALLLRRLILVSALCVSLVNLPSESNAAGSDIKVAISNTVISDSVSANNPKALSGAIIEYQARVMHSGQLALTSDSLAITNAIPPALSLIVADFPTRFVFADGAQPSDLTCTFQSLADNGDCVDFSSNGGISFDYQPSPNALGIDSAITHLRFRPRGAMAPAAPNPSFFFLRYQMKVD